MEHIEEAGVHSGDSSCVLPPPSLSEQTSRDHPGIHRPSSRARCNVIGLMNVQYAIKDGKVYVLEVNPRASRTVPYVSKATGVPLPKIAVGLMLGQEARRLRHFTGGIANGVLPVPQFFVKSPGVSVQQISRRRSCARTGDALHRRSHGRRRELWRGVRESAAQRRHVRCPTEGTCSSASTIATSPPPSRSPRTFRELGFESGRHARHRRRTQSRRASGKDRVQSERGPAQRGRSVEGRQSEPGHLHAPPAATRFRDEKAIRRNAVTYRIPVSLP